MDDIMKNPSDAVSLIKVKEETKCVLEAFLKRSLSQDEGTHIGHVGRMFHDPHKYSHRPQPDDKDGSPKKHKKSEKKKSKESIREKDEAHPSPKSGRVSNLEQNGTWNSLHEEINKVEEKKHGFQTKIKKLLRNKSVTKEKHPVRGKSESIESKSWNSLDNVLVEPKKENDSRKPTERKDKHSVKGKSSSLKSKSRDSLDNVLDEPKKDGHKKNSQKHPKSPNPLLACTLASSVDNFNETEMEETVDKPPKLGFSFKNILKKKSKAPKRSIDLHPSRPDFLPVTPCYTTDPPAHTEKADETEIYTLAAKKLDNLVRHQKLKSPVANAQSFGFPTEDHLKTPISNNNNVARRESEDKEETFRKLVSLLQEQAVVINDKINKDPFLKNALGRMSFGSFSRLAEMFTSQAEVATDVAGANVSPELTKIALTMELTRKVAGINSHAVHTLMGYSMEYMDMFVPWLQQQGGWENIVGDLTDFQID
ncbi:bcl-2-like protein 12 [Pelobates fuscus]|uniref:bcl-2-like protein 12 n=1 Tax=Pelobates fuscus TaxID=191477 RepID=UPI002FE4DFCB